MMSGFNLDFLQFMANTDFRLLTALKTIQRIFTRLDSRPQTSSNVLTSEP